MITRLIVSLTLLLGTGLAQATEADPKEIEHLQQQLEQAREDLAAAAQHLSGLQRKLLEAGAAGNDGTMRDDEGGMSPFRFDFDLGFDEEKARRMVLVAFPPRLGVLLGSPDSDEGNRVVGVTPGGGADQAGIRKDDRLLSVDGVDITHDTSARIREILAGYKSGDSIDVLVQRGDDQELVMPVKLGSALHNLAGFGERLGPMMQNIEREIVRVLPEGEISGRLAIPALIRTPGLAGLGRDTELVSNHPGLAPYFGADRGVLIVRIDPDNPLHLESGDVVLSVDGVTVDRPIDLGRILFSHDAGDQVILEVMRSGRPTEVFAKIPEPTARIRR
jgi:predicted metalloprotease with PDZ domain